MFPYSAKRSERLMKLIRFVYGRGKPPRQASRRGGGSQGPRA